MFKRVTISVLFLLTNVFVGLCQTVFINEIHYDNTGADVGEEFEIVGPSGTNLSCYRITLYNGSTGAAYATPAISGLIDNEGCGYGALSFSYSGIQNGAPDGISLYNTCTSTLIQFLSYEGAFTAIDGDAIGIGSVDIGVAESGTTPIGQSLQLTGIGTTYPSFSWNAPVASTNGSINSGQDFCTACTPVSEPTVNASTYNFTNIGCNGIEISWTSPAANDSSLVVIKAGSDVTTDPVDGMVYSANSTFGSGSDIGTSEFVVYSGAGNLVTVTGLSASTTYFVNIFEYNGESTCIDYRVSDEISISNTTVACDTCAYMTAALINSCDFAPCTEGDNEMLFLNSGNYYVSSAASDITINYGSSSPAAVTYGDSFTPVPGSITNMNSDPGCTGIYIDASTVSFIPPNSPFLILNETVCTDAFDWSTICAAVSGNIYVLFSDDVTWSSSGQFSNSPPAAGRFFRTILGGCTLDYSYDNALPSGDGAIIFWSNSAGTPTRYDTDGCSIPATTLPITLICFKGRQLKNGSNLIEWSTSSEINNAYFTIEQSINAHDFNEIGVVNGAGNSNDQLFYQFSHDNPKEGINYYRLKQTDFNGDYSYSDIIAINPSSFDYEIVYSNNYLSISSVSDKSFQVEIYDITGKIIYSNKINKSQKISTSKFDSGIYIIKISAPDYLFIRKFKF